MQCEARSGACGSETPGLPRSRCASVAGAGEKGRGAGVGGRGGGGATGGGEGGAGLDEDGGEPG